MSGGGGLKWTRPAREMGLGYHAFFALATKVDLPRFKLRATRRMICSSTSPDFTRCKAPGEISARFASSSSLNLKPRCALPMMSVKLSSKGIAAMRKKLFNHSAKWKQKLALPFVIGTLQGCGRTDARLAIGFPCMSIFTEIEL